MALFALAPLVSGYIVDLADDNSEIQIGGHVPGMATTSATCLGKAPAVVNLYPLEQRVLKQEKGLVDFEVEFAYIPFNCKDKAPWKEPCVTHDSYKLGAYKGSGGPSFFHAKFANENGNMMSACSNPWVEWAYIENVKVDQIVKTNCTMPTIEELSAAGGYDFNTGSLTMHVSILHGPADGTLNEIQYMGGTGGNLLQLTDMLTPPQAPSPPLSPSPPWLPKVSGPGSLFMNARKAIGSFQLPKLEINKLMTNLCWSSERGDTMSSSAFHSQCNSKGPTIYFAKTTYSSKEYIIGGYTRQNWYSSGYASDQYAAMFQVEPNWFYSRAGTGPHAAYNYAIYRSNGYGPTFGNAHDWLTSGNMKTGYSNIGYAYKCRIGNYGQSACQNDFFGSYSSWSITESEVWSENE